MTSNRGGFTSIISLLNSIYETSPKKKSKGLPGGPTAGAVGVVINPVLGLIIGGGAVLNKIIDSLKISKEEINSAVRHFNELEAIMEANTIEMDENEYYNIKKAIKLSRRALSKTKKKVDAIIISKHLPKNNFQKEYDVFNKIEKEIRVAEKYINKKEVKSYQGELVSNKISQKILKMEISNKEDDINKASKKHKKELKELEIQYKEGIISKDSYNNAISTLENKYTKKIKSLQNKLKELQEGFTREE